LGEQVLGNDSARSRQEFQRRIERRRLEKTDEMALKTLRRGWCLGPKEFRKELLDRIKEKKGKQHHGQELMESDERIAERLVRPMLRRQRRTLEQLRWQPKGNKVKTTMAKQNNCERTRR
jgi:hypothetical protein